MLNNFIYAETKDLFLEQLNAGNVLDEAIVFIADTGEIWNHGTYFAGDCGFDPSAFSDLQTYITNITTNNIPEGTNLYFTDGRARNAITGGASTIAGTNLTASKALISNGSGKVAVSDVTSTELGYLDGVTSNIQTQLNGKAASSVETTIANHIANKSNPHGVTAADLGISDASETQSGLINTSNQTFAGMKTFANGIKIGKDDANLGNMESTIFFAEDYDNYIGKFGQYEEYGSGVCIGIEANDEIRLNANSGIITFHSDTYTTNLIPDYTNGAANYGIGDTLWRYYDGYFSNKVYAAQGFMEESDERLKNFEGRINIDLDKLANLKKNYFTWKDKDDTNRQLGVSAQEIKELYPEIVSETEDGILNVAYDKLSVVALAAIDQLHDENKELKNKINTLEERLAKLESLLER